MYRIGIRGTALEYIIREDVYPFMEVDQFTGMPTTFLRLVVVDEDDVPTQFLVVMPTDIVYRRYPYDEETMSNILDAAKVAQERYVAGKEESERREREEEMPDDARSNHEGYYG
jgi:hypothetical protein